MNSVSLFGRGHPQPNSKDDRTIEGQVVDLSPDSFVVETKEKRQVKPEDFYKTTIIEFITIGAGDDIRFIEKPQFSLGKTLILVGAIAAPIVAIGLTAESPRLHRVRKVVIDRR